MQLDYGILCDQVRKEDNGKLLFVGVYTADIQVPRFPIKMKLALAIHFTPDNLGKEQVEVTVSFNGQKLLSGTSVIDVVAQKPSFAVFPEIPVHLQGPGTLEFKVDAGGITLQAWQGDVLT